MVNEVRQIYRMQWRSYLKVSVRDTNLHPFGLWSRDTSCGVWEYGLAARAITVPKQMLPVTEFCLRVNVPQDVVFSIDALGSHE
jgi:hypothetical protein